MNKVKVVRKKGRKHLVFRWTDPETGIERQKSAGTSNRKLAERLAGELEADLKYSRYDNSDQITWEDFRYRFEDEHLPSLAHASKQAYVGALNTFDRLMNPKRLGEVNAAAISCFQTRLRKTDVAEATVANKLRHIKAALRWAKSIGLMREVPEIKMPRRARGSKVMKGRPITEHEFEQMIAALPQVVPAGQLEAWEFYIRGLWWCGLRVGESLELYWDRDDRLRVDLSGKYGLLHIPAEWEKGGKDRVYPLAPEFVKHLEQVPTSERYGRVFSIAEPEGRSHLGNKNRVIKVGATIGNLAGIVVSNRGRNGKPKYASLHDLRRSFGVRWSERVLPQQLQEIMRHESISTTQLYYVGHDADRTASLMWRCLEGRL